METYAPTIETLKKIVEEQQHQTIQFEEGNSIVDLFSASALVAVYNALSRESLKEHFRNQIKSRVGYLVVLDFAFERTQ
jgi:hypothetical protein